jgi:tetratricopeptide (TPR) repeat protein
MGTALTELEAAVRLGRSRMREVAAGSREQARPPFDLGELPATDHFVGRESDLRWIAERLVAQPGSDQNIVAIAATNGLPGIGKSALAAMAARRLFSTGAFPDGIAVVRCNDLVNPVDVLQRTFARFDSAQQMPTEGDLTALGAQLREKLNGKRALIVLDNVEPGWPIWEVTQRIRATGAALLLTSRQELPTTAVPMGTSRMLELLDEDQAVEVFAENFGLASSQKLAKEQRAKALRIINTLGRHTLAVKLVATSLAREPRDWQAVADEYEKSIGLALELKENISEEEAARARAAVAVGQSLQESVNSLPKRARAALMSWGAFAAPDFGRQAALAAARSILETDRECRGALSEVVGWRLAETWVNQQIPEESDHERIRLHPLVHAYARQRLLKLDSDQQQTIYVAIASWYADYTNATPDLALAPDEASIIGALEWLYGKSAELADANEVLAKLCEGMQVFWRDTWRTKQLLHYLQVRIAALRTLDEPTRLAYMLRDYGLGLLTKGDMSGAEAAFTESLALFKGLDDALGTAYLREMLGRIAQRRGDLNKAETEFKAAEQEYRKAGAKRAIRIVMVGLGQIALARGRLEEAQSYYEQALTIAREAQNRREEGASLSDLGQIAFLRQSIEEARNYYEQALTLIEEIQDRQAEDAIFSNLGKIALAQGRVKEAGEYFQQSLVIRREIQDRKGEGVVLYYLALIAEQRDNLNEAEAYHRESLDISLEVENGRDIADSLSTLGIFLLEHERNRDEGCQMLAEAARLYDQMGIPGADEARETARQLGCEG